MVNFLQHVILFNQFLLNSLTVTLGFYIHLLSNVITNSDAFFLQMCMQIQVKHSYVKQIQISVKKKQAMARQ